ncbi:MAG: GGDEF domain-containing protein [Gammaproteobacteria bacterium]|nr:GGDEF domain-containing protein [Gammaproteobacteria bacterium]
MSAAIFKLLGFSAAMLIFAFDAMLPFGVAAGVSYVLLVLLSLITQRRWDAVGMAIIGSLLTIIGYFISEPGGIHYMVLINRGIALAVIWAACIIMVIHFSSLAELKTMAILDHVTGLYNRHYFFIQAERILKGWTRYKTPVTLMLIDMDDFKKINDTYGHDAGDRVLKHVADTLKQCLRDVDVIARIGGEEFVVLLPSTTIDAGDVVAEKVRSAIENITLTYQQQEIKVTVSIGVVAASRRWQLIGDLLKAADKLLYQAKHRGKNHVAIEGFTVFPQARAMPNMVSH